MYKDMAVFPLERPAVRPLELTPAEVDGEMALVVRDPLGILEGPIVLAPNPLVLMFLELADGNTDLPEMAHILAQETGQIIPHEILAYIAGQLDEALLLQSERFKEACRTRVEAFLRAPVRACSLLPANGTDRLAAIKELSDEIRSHTNRALSPPARLEPQLNGVSAVIAPQTSKRRSGHFPATRHFWRNWKFNLAASCIATNSPTPPSTP
jgi:hypothetical protein